MEDRALRLGAGLAYYGLITLVPLAILLVSIAGLLVGEEAATGQLAESLEQWFGPDVAQAFGEVVVVADVAGSFANLTIFSVIALIFAKLHPLRCLEGHPQCHLAGCLPSWREGDAYEASVRVRVRWGTCRASHRGACGRGGAGHAVGRRV